MIDSQYQSNLLNLCHEVGSIVRCNNRYTKQLTDAVMATGKKPEQLTIGELRDIHLREGERYNEGRTG